MSLADDVPQPYPAQGLWTQGWLSVARQLPSPNFDPRPLNRSSVDLIVLHSISLPPGQFGTGAVQALFTNQLDWHAHPYFQTIQGLKVSAHFFVERTGLLWQFVSCDHRAWHAGTSSYKGRANCNDYSIGIELEGLEGQLFEPAQYQSLAVLCQQLRQQYPISAIAGHEHIAPGRKADPGAGFDWHLLQQQLPWPQHFFTCTAPR